MIGTRVEIHPRFDEWMRGDRFGTVIEVISRGERVRVRLDKSQKVRSYALADLAWIS
jgi:hypothetical protein